jgi:hypothetical protein
MVGTVAQPRSSCCTQIPRLTMLPALRLLLQDSRRRTRRRSPLPCPPPRRLLRTRHLAPSFPARSSARQVIKASRGVSVIPERTELQYLRIAHRWILQSYGQHDARGPRSPSFSDQRLRPWDPSSARAGAGAGVVLWPISLLLLWFREVL